MAIDVLSVNAILQENDRLKKSINAGVLTFAEKFARCPLDTSTWTSIPLLTGTSFNVCSGSSDYTGSACCLWTVPGGATKAQFQIWGAGSPSGPVMCCMFAPFGDTGAYATAIIDVVPGCQYTLCAGCAHDCYNYAFCCTFTNQGGCKSFVIGHNLTNFCAEGGANSYVEATMADTRWNGSLSSVCSCCRYHACSCNGNCLCFCGMSVCQVGCDTGCTTCCGTVCGVPFSASSFRKGYGSVTNGVIFTIPSLHSAGHSYGCGFMCSAPSITPTHSNIRCNIIFSYCCSCFNGQCVCYCGGCYCRAACGIFQTPGAGGFAAWANFGFLDIRGDTGRAGMVRVTYC